MSPLPVCDCADPGCPVHLGTASCPNPATLRLYRTDQEDEDGTAFCGACADDALEAGVFTTAPGDGYVPEDAYDEECAP